MAGPLMDDARLAVAHQRLGVRVVAGVKCPGFGARVVEDETTGTIVQPEGDVVCPVFAACDAVLDSEVAPLHRDRGITIEERIALATFVGLEHDIVITACLNEPTALPLEHQQGTPGASLDLARSSSSFRPRATISKLRKGCPAE